jgi:hypothetical protein
MFSILTLRPAPAALVFGTIAALGVLPIASFAGAPAPLVQVTLDTPDLSVVQPASGSVQYFFTGTLEHLTSDTLNYSGSTLGGLQSASGAQIATVLAPLPFPTAPNSKVSGDLFSFTVDANTPLGLYGAPGGGPALFTEQGFDTANNQTFDVPANFTVTVTAPAAAVPESSPAISLGLLLGLGGLTMRAKRKIAPTRGTRP